MNILTGLKNILNIPEKINSLQDPINSIFKSIFELENIKINQGLILSAINFFQKKEEIIKDIKKSEFKIFSQWGDDGIIDFLVTYLEIEDTRFVEFGVENYTECNTKFLLMSKNWKGLIMDGSFSHMNGLRNSHLYWKFDIKVIDIFITKDNINTLLKANGFDGEIGLLHIDIDGNDYWIWNEVKEANPIIVIVEYNSVFGYSNPYSTIYEPSFDRGKHHYSKLLYGSSLMSLCDLAEEKGYAFIGCNSNGNNAYFVRKDKLKGLKPLTVEQGYVESKFSESRDQSGKLSYLRGEERLNLLKGSEIFNTRTKKTDLIK